MDRIEDLTAFVAVFENGSLTAAARQLGRSLQSVSRSLAKLEAALGAELVRRTTRRSSPTEAGMLFYRRIKDALAEIEQARNEVSQHRAVATGRLRVGASLLFAPAYVVPAIAAFMERHSGIKVELLLSDEYVDLVAGRFDVVIRIGDLPNSGLIARRLGGLRRVVFGAPAYFAKHDRPRVPADLGAHQCVVRTRARGAEKWPFVVKGRAITVAVSGRFRTDGAAAANEAVALGLGIGMAPLWQIRSLVDSGRVELVLTDVEPPPVPIHAVWPASAALPAKTRLFIDFLAARLTAERI